MTVIRRVTFKLYPSKTQERRMFETLDMHRELYNAALQQRIEAWKRRGKSLNLYEQQRELKDLRALGALADERDFSTLNAQSQGMTLKRLDDAFQSFFRRIKAGHAPGFPRFKSRRRFTSWTLRQTGYKAHSAGGHGKLHLSGIGMMQMRGSARQWGEVRTATIMHKRGKWYASIAIKCEVEREGGERTAGMDWGIENFITLTDENGEVETVENPRFLNRSLDRLKHEQRSLSRKKRFSKNWRKQKALIANLSAKIARQQRDFMHKLSAKLVSAHVVIATEELNVSGMTAGGGAYKTGLNRAILETAPATFLSMLRYKAEEAGITLHEVNTRAVKPSQTCPDCGRQEKKPLSQRQHACKQCGLRMSRDGAAALVMLNVALHGQPTGRRSARCGGRQLCLL